MALFITGEGCFFIKVNKSRNKAGVQLVFFKFLNNIRDQELLKSFVSYFNCGQYINSFWPAPLALCNQGCIKQGRQRLKKE
jgi:hypothetical protein